jgi:colanic acid/amylovoran biosynthesis glycosyltransferase
LPASVPVAVIPPAPEPVPFVERAFPSNNMNLLFVGRLHWIKGLTYLLDAIALLKKKSIPLSLTVVGEGEEAEALVFQAHQLDISDCVYFAGKMKRNDLLVAYAAHDYYIQPSLSEGFCNAVLEAQQAGMIVMAADAGALSENIVNNETGFLFLHQTPWLWRNVWKGFGINR